MKGLEAHLWTKGNSTEKCQWHGGSMKLLSVAVALALYCLSVFGQDRPVKIALTPSTTVPVADLTSEFGKRCPNVGVTLNTATADFTMEAVGGDHASHQRELRNFKLAVFDHDGTAVFNASAHSLANAIKDVCGYIHTSQGQRRSCQEFATWEAGNQKLECHREKSIALYRKNGQASRWLNESQN